MNRFWNDERVQALKKLAECLVYRPSGIQEAKRDWELGLKNSESQDLTSYKLLKKIPIKIMKSAWTRYKNVANGYCSTAFCPNKIIPGKMHCEKCQPETTYHRGVYSNPSIKENMDLVKKVLADTNGADVKKVLLENIELVPFTMKRKILGDSFRELVIDKEAKKKKKA